MVWPWPAVLAVLVAMGLPENAQNSASICICEKLLHVGHLENARSRPQMSMKVKLRQRETYDKNLSGNVHQIWS